MTKNEITLQSSKSELSLNVTLSVEPLTAWLAKTSAIQSLARFYAFWLEESVSAKRAVYFLYAQVFATLTLLPCHLHLGWRACALLLFCQTVSRAFKS